jgi:hypothetical protein
LPKNFWDEVAESMTPLAIFLSPDDNHYDKVEELNLLVYNLMSSPAIKKKVMVLLKVQKQVQTNMTLSGKHDSDAYYFIEVAMKKVAGKSTLTVLGCYYYF